MKMIHFAIDDDLYDAIIKVKGSRTWQELFIDISQNSKLRGSKD